MMDRARLDVSWTWHGFQALVLENRWLRVVILPELGGKIWSIVAKRHDRELLWHNPRVPPRAAYYGAAYDNWFSGGWDELFPNDAEVTIAGETYPDHGEIWSLASEWDVVRDAPDAVSVRLTNHGVATASRFEKTLTLRAGEQRLHLDYRITNEGASPLDFLWKLHPALRLDPDSRLDLPAGRVIVDPQFQAPFAAEEFRWPLAPGAEGAMLDMRCIPGPEAKSVHFYYAVELEAGWGAVTHPAAGVGFGLAFDPEILRTVWIFGSYGGWRGLHTAILEPCTGYPFDLQVAIDQGTATTLAPGAALETSVVATVFTGLRGVTTVSREGDVKGEAVDGQV